MWNVGAREHSGHMIVLAHAAVLFVALIIIAMALTPLIVTP